MKRRRSRKNASYVYHKGAAYRRSGRGAYKRVKNPHRSKKYAKKRNKHRRGKR